MSYNKLNELTKEGAMKEVKVVNFYGDKLYLVEFDGEPYIPLRPIVENLGLYWNTQRRKLIFDPTRWQIQMVKIKTNGGTQEMLCLPLRKLPAWLMSISPRKVKPELREKLLRYQEECDKVLWDYWMKGQAVNPRKAQPVLDFEDAFTLPPVRYECRGYIYKWYFPVDLLAHILRVKPEDILSFLDPGDYIENPEITGYFRRNFPKYASFIKSDMVVFDSGMRKLFARNLILRASETAIKKLFQLVKRLDRYGIDPEVAFKIKKAREAGFTYEEISRMVGLSRDKVRHLVELMREVMERKDLPVLT